MSTLQAPDLNLEDSGISEEDRREITEQIEAISLESRIEITPETFRFRGSRRSGVLPLLANVVALVLTTAGVLGAYLLFQERQSEISTSEGTFTTAEGRLIAEVRRQTADQLGAKDRAMGDVRRQLTEVQFQRDEILAEIDIRVRDREEELRRTLIVDLEAERERLIDGGASESTIQARLVEIANNQDAQIEALLSSFRRQLESEYATNLARLQALQREYEEELRALQQERLTITRDSEEREQTLREQIVTAEADRTAGADGAAETEAARQAAREAAAEADAASTALTAARAELAALAATESRKTLVDAQINGLYRQIAERVLLTEYPAALARLASLRALLSDPDFANLPGIQERVAVDLAVAQTLEVLIRAQIAARPERTEAEELLGRLRTTVQRAQALAQQGDEPAAREAYLTALRVVPEVLASYNYLRERERVEANARLLEIDASRAASDARALELATTLAVAGERIQALAEAQVQGQTRIEELELVRVALQARVEELEASVAAARKASTAETFAAEAFAELERARAQAAAAETSDEIAAVRAQLEPVIDGLEREVAALTTRLDDARGRVALQSARVDALSARERDLTAQLEPIGELADRYEAMLARYGEYTVREDEALAGSGAGSIAEAKLELDAFLTSPVVLEAFPQLFDRFSRYQRAFEAEGRETAILELIDVVYNLSVYDTSDDRVAFLEREIVGTEEGSFLRDFLVELVYVVER